MTTEEVENIVTKTVSATLAGLGIHEDEHEELRADFNHLRRWRKSVEQAQSYTFKTVITVVATGIIGALWLGIKVMLGK